MADGDQPKDQQSTPLASAAQKVKDKDVEVFAFSTKPRSDTNMDDLRKIASRDDNVYAVAPDEPAPAITTKIASQVKTRLRGEYILEQIDMISCYEYLAFSCEWNIWNQGTVVRRLENRLSTG